MPLTRTFVYEPRPDRVLRTGPFRFVRHPLYLAYSLAWLAAPVAMNSALLGLTAAGLIACYAASAVEEERRLLASPLGAEIPRVHEVHQAHRAVRLLITYGAAETQRHRDTKKCQSLLNTRAA